MKRLLITVALTLPGSIALGYIAQLDFIEHLAILLLLFGGGTIDGDHP